MPKTTKTNQPEPKVGTVARITIDTGQNYRAMYTETGFDSTWLTTNGDAYDNNEILRYETLPVLDISLDDLMEKVEDVKPFLDATRVFFSSGRRNGKTATSNVWSFVTDVINSVQPTEQETQTQHTAKMQEPTGVGAVVKSKRGAYYSRGADGKWRTSSGNVVRWDDILHYEPTLVSTGVTGVEW